MPEFVAVPNKIEAQGNRQQWQYLQVHFAHIDILVRREVRRWVLASQDPNDDYRGMYVTQAEAEALLERPFGTSWGQWIELPAEEEVAFQAESNAAQQQIDTVEKQFEEAGQTPHLKKLAQNFGLDQTDLHILLLCIAPAFDTSYERLYGYLQDNVTKRRPSVRLVLDILGAPGVDQFTLADHLRASSPLFAHGLIEHVVEPLPTNGHWLNQSLHVDETIIAWLRGHYQHQGLLTSHIALLDVEPTDSDLLLAGNLPLVDADSDTDGKRDDKPIFALYGIDQNRKDAAARIMADEQSAPLLTLDLKQVVDEKVTASEAIQLALRDARLTGAILYIYSWDLCLDEDKYATPAILNLICQHPNSVMLSSEVAWQPRGITRTRPLINYEFNIPNFAQRRSLWNHYLKSSHLDEQNGLTDLELDNLASQFELTSGTIRDAVAAARDAYNRIPNTLGLSAVEGEYRPLTTDHRPPLTDHLFLAARRYSNPRLAALAHKIDPRYEWNDIVLPEDQRAILRELVATVRQRNKVLEEWGVGKKLAASKGVSILFAGPPGTGKTMAAEVIAGELRLDLYKIDLSSVVSKFIGETEKNLEKIFTEASSSNAILFFDEADAIFGKRSEVKDAHDRHANVEVAYLLQRMEAYDGVTILATNLRGNLDDAFTRRLHFAVDFPFPRAKDRLHIWQTLFPPEVPRDEELDLDFFAKEFELAGGNIRNIIVSAAYLAADNGQVVTKEHLLHGTKRELMKMGRLIWDGEF